MKVTMQALLINMDEENINIINKLMLVFCSAVRYSFKRLLEGKKVGDIEKNIAFKYGLNIRQSKDAVENARQTIVSQKELLKLNYDSCEKKANAILSILNDKKKIISAKKKNSLFKKLDKRQRKLQYFKSFIDANTIPSVTFGKKEMFIKRCKGLISREEWQDYRSNRVYSRGDKSKSGNPNLRIIRRDNKAFLEISTLDKSDNNRAIKVSVEVYLPQKLSTTTGKVNGRNYKQMFLEFLETGEAYQVELLRRKGRYYCHITFEENIVRQYETLYTAHNGIIGIDTNPDGFALTMIDNKGNYKWHTYLKSGELTYARSDRRKNLCGELVKQAVLKAEEHGVGIAVEDLKFVHDKDVNSKFARIKHQFIYRQLLIMLESACRRSGIEIIKVKPQFTSKIGLYKYCHQYGMAVHNGAGMVIGRRSYTLKEKTPKILKEKMVSDLEKFEKKNEWSKWNDINKSIKRKVGENPALWLIIRKRLLGIA